MDLKERAKKLKTDIPAIFLALKDHETPLLAKIFAGITVIYALSPIDLDDLILLPMFAALTIKFIPKDVFERNRKASEGMWNDGKPEKWYYAIPMVLVWFIIAGILIKIFLL